MPVATSFVQFFCIPIQHGQSVELDLMDHLPFHRHQNQNVSIIEVAVSVPMSQYMFTYQVLSTPIMRVGYYLLDIHGVFVRRCILCHRNQGTKIGSKEVHARLKRGPEVIDLFWIDFDHHGVLTQKARKAFGPRSAVKIQHGAVLLKVCKRYEASKVKPWLPRLFEHGRFTSTLACRRAQNECEVCL